MENEKIMVEYSKYFEPKHSTLLGEILSKISSIEEYLINKDKFYPYKSNAHKAYCNSMDYLLKNNLELNEVLQKIEIASKEGKFELCLGSLLSETVFILKQVGFEIDLVANLIKWESPGM